MAVYKKEFKNLGGYLVDMSRVTYNKISIFILLEYCGTVKLKIFPVSMYKSSVKIKEQVM